jgi:hypothetical protein
MRSQQSTRLGPHSFRCYAETARNHIQLGGQEHETAQRELEWQKRYQDECYFNSLWGAYEPQYTWKDQNTPIRHNYCMMMDFELYQAPAKVNWAMKATEGSFEDNGEGAHEHVAHHPNEEQNGTQQRIDTLHSILNGNKSCHFGMFNELINSPIIWNIGYRTALRSAKLFNSPHQPIFCRNLSSHPDIVLYELKKPVNQATEVH